ncbi:MULTISPECIES: hypothetical protein [Calothrix]|uniref:Uncharacterized protein n=2 Tax=Calothrix TaxID=1186 RepID=A0ABR8A6E6_9CYAN|nr:MULTISPECIES: hypothetical protein [Calothrix]MBD2194985.1 hypothetical protein [Calothrix parietina FACHB-288]MBD2223583.1 hypothetical protein [Calothrix anomala FACHB-343]
MKNSTHKGMEFLGIGNWAWGMGNNIPFPATSPKRRGCNYELRITNYVDAERLPVGYYELRISN